MERAVFARKASDRAEAVEEWSVRLGLLLLVILLLATAAPAVLSWADRTPAAWLPAAGSIAALLVWNLIDRGLTRAVRSSS